MPELDKIKIAILSNLSRAKTGFGQNLKNILLKLSEDERFEVVEIANGAPFGMDLKTPWKSYGSFPSNPAIQQELQRDPYKHRLAEYGNFTIDEIIQLEKPDTLIGIEDIWAFDWVKRDWLGKINTIIWTTLDSLPIIDQAYHLAPKVNKFLVWASFAEEEMKKRGFDVETLHGAIDYSSFKPLLASKKKELRQKHGLKDEFITGFVFKNQLRKSVPNLLEGFKRFKKTRPNSKLLLHTDWQPSDNSWDIPRYIQEKKLDNNDILTTYICKACHNYSIRPFTGEDLNCHHCGNNALATKTSMFGLSEEQLNEVYNIMDVYCHPFTSGGQELPIQEAKAAGLITLVTEYSCGTDSCYEEDGGIPLKWVEYREPISQFIKATTLPDSICENLERVYSMSKEEKERLSQNSINCVKTKFSIDKIVDRLKEILLELGKTDWDFKPGVYNPDYQPDTNLSNKEWLIDLYKGMVDKKFTERDIEIVEGIKILERDGRQPAYDYLQNVARAKLEEQAAQKPRSIEDYFEGEGEKRIAVVIPESAGDVLMVNSLITNLKSLYPEYNIYFITSPQYYSMIDDHPDIRAIIPYAPNMDNLLVLEGVGEHKGYFDIAFLPFVGSQRYLNYLHNSKDRDGLQLIN